MLKVSKTQAKTISILISLIFIGSAVAMGLMSFGDFGKAGAASSAIGVIDYQQAGQQSPDLKAAEEAMKKAEQDAQADFQAKSADMSDQQKQEYYQQTIDRLQKTQADLLEPITQKLDATIKEVAEKKGLSVVLDKRTVHFGGVDITSEVIKQMTAKK